MICNYRNFANGAAVNLFPITDSSRFMQWSDWKDNQAYYCTGLDYPMLVCPFPDTYDEKLILQSGIDIKANIPLGGILYFPKKPDHFNRNDFLIDTAWMVDSYLFKLNSTILSGSRFYVDYANNIPNRGLNFFDNGRIFADNEICHKIELLHNSYAHQLLQIIAANPSKINVRNYKQTSLLNEIILKNDLKNESMNYLQALIDNKPAMLNNSRLTNGYKHIEVTKKYNPVLLSFYFAFIKEAFPNSPGSYIGMFKSLYNILEYLMEGEGKNSLQSVIEKYIGTEILKRIVKSVKESAPAQSAVSKVLIKGERLSDNLTLPPLSENDNDLADKISYRFYTKRNAALHSKKFFKNVPVEFNIRPGIKESFQLEADITLLKPIAEIIVEEIPSDI